MKGIREGFGCWNVPQIIADIFNRGVRVKVPSETETFFETAQQIVAKGTKLAPETQQLVADLLASEETVLNLGSEGLIKALSEIPDYNQRVLATGALIDALSDIVAKGGVSDELVATALETNAKLLGLDGLWSNAVAHSSLVGLGEWVRRMKMNHPFTPDDIELMNQIRRLGGATDDLPDANGFETPEFVRGLFMALDNIIAPLSPYVDDVDHPIMRSTKSVLYKVFADAPEIAEEAVKRGVKSSELVKEVVDDIFGRIYADKPYRKFSPLTKRVMKGMGIGVNDLPSIANPFCPVSPTGGGGIGSDVGRTGALVGAMEALQPSPSAVPETAVDEALPPVPPSDIPPIGGGGDDIPPVDPFDQVAEALPPPLEAPIPEELGDDIRAVVRELNRTATPDPVALDRLQIIGDAFFDGIHPAKVDTLIRRLGHLLPPSANPAQITELQNNPFFGIRRDRGRLRFYKKGNFDAKLNAEIENLIREFPFLRLYSRDYLATFAVGRSLGRSLLPSEYWGQLDSIFFSRLLWYTPEEHLPLAIEGLAKLWTDERIFAPEVIEEAIQKYLLKAHTYNILETALQKQPIVLDDGQVFLTKGDWEQLGILQREAILENIVNNLDGFVENNFTDLDPNQIRQMAKGEATLRNPFVLRSLLEFAEANGMDTGVALMSAKVLASTATSLRTMFSRYGAVGAAPHMGAPFTVGENIPLLGEKPLRSWIQHLKDVYKVRYGKISPEFSALEEAITASDLLGYDLVRYIVGLDNDIEKFVEDGVDNLYNFAYLLYNQFVEKGQGAIVYDAVSALAWLSQRYADQIGELLSPHRTPTTPYSLRTILKAMGYDDPQSVMRQLYDVLQKVDPKYAQWFFQHSDQDIYVPSIVKELLLEEIQPKTLWDFLNDVFKQLLVVYNPPTQIRNFITNLGLMTIGTGEPFSKVVWETLKSVKENDTLTQRLRRLHPSFGFEPPLTVPEGMEGLLFNATPFQRNMRKLSELPFLKQMNRAMSYAEALAKNAFVRIQIRQKYGDITDEIINRISDEELLQYVLNASEWLVDYRIVPPAIQYLRKTLGLFPFITFFYTIASQFLTNPDKLAETAIRTAYGMHRAMSFIAPEGSPYSVSEEEKQILPDYLQHPLTLTWKDSRGNMRAFDLSYWLPLGVFEGWLRSAPKSSEKSLKDWLIWTGAGLGDTALNQVGSLIRPLFELLANKSLLTGQGIYEEVDPPAIRRQKVMRHLLEQSPLVRSLIKMAEGLGFETPFIPPRQRTSADPVSALDAAVRSFFGLRGFKPDELLMQKANSYLIRINEIKSLMRRTLQNENIPVQRRLQMLKQYEDEIVRLTTEMEGLYRVPVIFNLDALRSDQSLPTDTVLQNRLSEPEEEEYPVEDFLPLYLSGELKRLSEQIAMPSEGISGGGFGGMSVEDLGGMEPEDLGGMEDEGF